MANQNISCPPEKPHGIFKESRYIYKPLESTQSVRFLVLQPGSGSDPLIGSLESGSLQNITQFPPYEALSYVWGNSDRKHKLDCDGNILPLTDSIYNALNCVRLPDQPRRLWADQVCINQDCIPERSQQVKLMNLIYKSAKAILVWLGQDSDNVAKGAKQAIYHLNDVFKDNKASKEFKSAGEESLAIKNSRDWTPFSKLTRLPWFERVWIAQEIGTSAPAILYWGNIEIDWDILSSVATILNDDHYHFRTRFSIHTNTIRYLCRRFVMPDTTHYNHNHNRNKGDFAYELHKARALLATDPRDRIYAFLGHYSVNQSGKELQSLIVDYSKSLKAVYVDVAVRILRNSKGLTILSSAQRASKPFGTPGREYSQMLGLPSWVPDWRCLPLPMVGTPDTPHRASKDTKPDLSIDEDAQCLHIRGIRVDIVTKRSWKMLKTAFQIHQDAQETNEERRNLRNVLQQQALDLATDNTHISSSHNRDNHRAHQQDHHPSFQQRNSQSNSSGRHTHVMVGLWKHICGYETFNLTRTYPPFLENFPAVTSTSSSLSFSSSSSSSPTSLYSHTRSAFFAFIQTLTNCGMASSSSDLYSNISSEELLANGAAYLVRYAQPQSSQSVPFSFSSSSIITESQSQTRQSSSFPSASISRGRENATASGRSSSNEDSRRGRGRVRCNSNVGPMAAVYERANFLASQHDPISHVIHDLARNGDPFKWSHQAVLTTRNNRFAVTKMGYFLLGPDAIQKDDVVVILRGGKVPFVLRKVDARGNGDNSNSRWILVGECYVHGLMDGERWDLDRIEEEVFVIK